jgi:actin-related protein 8
MIFTKICFNKLYIHLESVLACLGTAISSAVVVDIGHEKINICCVDEGVILPKTLVRKNFGLKHTSKTMIKLFNSKIN